MTHGASPSPEFLIERVLRANEVHLLYGPIIEENTLFTLQIVSAWLRGEEVFGHASHPQPACYVSCDRSLASLHEDMASCGIRRDQFAHFSLTDHTQNDDRTVASALNLARERVPGLRLLVLDGLYSLCPGHINFYQDAAKFLIASTQLCKAERVTILGCVSSVKSREGEGYASARDRLPGSIAWAGMTRTKILLEPNHISRHDDDSRRVMIMAPALNRTLMLQYVKHDHIFEYQGQGIAQTDMDTWLTDLPPGTVLSIQELKNAAESLEVSRATLYRWLADQITLGAILKTGHGIYTVPGNPTPQN